MRIVISGSSGIGKTTLSKALADSLGYQYVPDLIDHFLKDMGFKSWFDCASKETEKRIRFEALEEKIRLETQDDIVSDKGIIDYLAYWLILCSDHATKLENTKFIDHVRAHISKYDKIVILKFDLYTFEVVKRRNPSYTHRLRIHSLIRGLYNELGCKYREYSYNFEDPIKNVIEDLNIVDNKSKRIGIFLGTFDPIHSGHQKVIEHTCKLFDEIWVQPHPDVLHDIKKHESFENRVKMIQIATSELNNVCPRIVSFRNISSQNYRTESILSAVEEFPNYSFWIIMGSDKLNHPAYKSGTLLRIPHCIFLRGNLSDCVRAALRQFKRVELIKNLSEISATKVRDCIRKRGNITGFLHPSVVDFIKKNNLYTHSN